MGRSCVVAVVQADVAPDLEAGLERTAQLAQAAAHSGATLIVFPETWLPGYPAWLDVCRDVALWDHPPVKAVFARLAENSVAVPSAAVDALAAIARDAAATLVLVGHAAFKWILAGAALRSRSPQVIPIYLRHDPLVGHAAIDVV